MKNSVSLWCLFSKDMFVDMSAIKGQLQRFHKLISNDRIWPSEHSFEVIFEKSLFVFEISAFKVRNKRGIHSRFHSFSENNNRETFVCDVTSDQSSMISTERSDLRDCKASGYCYVWWFLEEIMVYCVAYDCLKFQADNQRRMQAVTTNDLRASSSKTTPNLIVQS